MTNSVKSLFLVIVIALISNNAYAQKPPVKFGDVSKNELSMTDYQNEPGAEAVILCDFSIISVDIDANDIKANYNHLRRVKIFTKEGYDWATFSIPLYKVKDGTAKETVNGLKGFTYNLVNGEIVKSKLEKSAIFVEKVTDSRDRLKFTMPDVKEGSIIEFSYTKTSDFLGRLDPWYFQKSIPVQWSEVYFKIPQYYTYLHISGGYETFLINQNITEPKTLSVTSSEREYDARGAGPTTTFSTGSINYNVYINHWAVKDMPSLKDEKYVGNIDDYRQKMEFQLATTNFNNEFKDILGTWESINERFLEEIDNFGQNMKEKGFYKDVLDTLIKTTSTPTEKAIAITRFVNERVNWDEIFDYMPEKNIKKVFDDRTGSSAEINALLISMLRASGIEADPVLISTRSHGLIHPIYPMLDKFNHMIAVAWIGGKELLLDASDQDVPAGLLPIRCLNQTGRCISVKHNTWINLVPVKNYDQIATGNFVLKDDKIVGELSIKKSGYAAIDGKSDLRLDKEEKYLEELKKQNPAWTITNYSIENPEGNDGDLKEKYSIEIADGLMNTGELIYIDPIFYSKFDENPLKNENRKFPVDLGEPIKQQFMINITIPSGYIVEELPKSVQLTTQDKSAGFKYIVGINGNIIQLSTLLEIKKGFYLTEDYASLREFFGNVVQKSNEQIVIKKMVQ